MGDHLRGFLLNQFAQNSSGNGGIKIISAERTFQHEAVNIFCAVVMPVVAQLAPDVKDDHGETGQPDSQTQNVDKGEEPVP